MLFRGERAASDQRAHGACDVRTSERGTGAWLAGGELLLATTIFIACAAHVRARFRHAAGAA